MTVLNRRQLVASLLGFCGFLLRPQRAESARLAASPSDPTFEDQIQGLIGADIRPGDPRGLQLLTPDTAENGALVPVTLASNEDEIRDLYLLFEANPHPLLAHFSFKGVAKPKVSLRVRLNQSGPLILIGKGQNLHGRVQKEVKVALGGCN